MGGGDGNVATIVSSALGGALCLVCTLLGVMGCYVRKLMKVHPGYKTRSRVFLKEIEPVDLVARDSKDSSSKSSPRARVDPETPPPNAAAVPCYPPIPTEAPSETRPPNTDLTELQMSGLPTYDPSRPATLIARPAPSYGQSDARRRRSLPAAAVRLEPMPFAPRPPGCVLSESFSRRSLQQPVVLRRLDEGALRPLAPICQHGAGTHRPAPAQPPCTDSNITTRTVAVSASVLQPFSATSACYPRMMPAVASTEWRIPGAMPSAPACTVSSPSLSATRQSPSHPESPLQSSRIHAPTSLDVRRQGPAHPVPGASPASIASEADCRYVQPAGVEGRPLAPAGAGMQRRPPHNNPAFPFRPGPV